MNFMRMNELENFKYSTVLTEKNYEIPKMSIFMYN